MIGLAIFDSVEILEQVDVIDSAAGTGCVSSTPPRALVSVTSLGWAPAESVACCRTAIPYIYDYYIGSI